jgi:hypothetical protein
METSKPFTKRRFDREHEAGDAGATDTSFTGEFFESEEELLLDSN